uniref:Uncharacterized LOC100181103 n=1 Tax=Ciona intestinalis TaxID=7719 RepID=F6VPH3_CIOIN|nr:uncharacterized protein LOC100181103 [Ciona intestinalis]|eukprot:XP_002130589.1 uncharacterized protein LOC100181103 [Ciona intestinalis]
MMSRIPRLLLFDIDGTLTTSAHTVGKGGSSLLKALSVAFDRNIERNGVVFSGGTDPSITKDVLIANGITSDNSQNYAHCISKAFEMLPGVVKTGIADGSYCWKSLPKVNELLQVLSKRKDVKLALLTGNLQATALLKLKSAQIDVDLFKLENTDELFGAFGSDPHDQRSDLVTVAKARYSEFLGHKNITPNDMIVIGDSPKDIECAHANNVPCLAVATGMFKTDQLQTADCVLENFQNVDETVRAIVETIRKI